MHQGKPTFGMPWFRINLLQKLINLVYEKDIFHLTIKGQSTYPMVNIHKNSDDGINLHYLLEVQYRDAFSIFEYQQSICNFLNLYKRICNVTKSIRRWAGGPRPPSPRTPRQGPRRPLSFLSFSFQFFFFFKFLKQNTKKLA